MASQPFRLYRSCLRESSGRWRHERPQALVEQASVRRGGGSGAVAPRGIPARPGPCLCWSASAGSARRPRRHDHVVAGVEFHLGLVDAAMVVVVESDDLVATGSHAAQVSRPAVIGASYPRWSLVHSLHTIASDDTPEDDGRDQGAEHHDPEGDQHPPANRPQLAVAIGWRPARRLGLAPRLDARRRRCRWCGGLAIRRDGSLSAVSADLSVSNEPAACRAGVVHVHVWSPPVWSKEV
jgi:hypothetical protein